MSVFYINDFSREESNTLRILAVVSSSLSIVAGISAFYFMAAIDKSKKVFRHQLIVFLLLFDMLKAVVLLIFPARVIAIDAQYSSKRFCYTVGFFTATSIEGADLAILTFAIHTALIIFKPSFGQKSKEGGLYRLRYLVYFISFAVPVLLASLAFINKEPYIASTTWCYLPPRPLWMRLVLSWAPRYFIICVILIIYISIYLHVIRQFNLISNNVNNLNKSHATPDQLDSQLVSQSWWKYFSTQFLLCFVCFQSLTDKNDDDSQQYILPTLSNQNTNSSSPINPPPQIHESPTQLQLQHQNLQAEIHEATVTSFQIRKSNIEKQMKSIFAYPISYIFLWLAPFILQCLQFKYELHHRPVYWIACLAAFMQPFNCTVDTCVFLFRERPWHYTTNAIKSRHPVVHVHGQPTFTNDIQLHNNHHTSTSTSQISQLLHSLKQSIIHGLTWFHFKKPNKNQSHPLDNFSFSPSTPKQHNHINGLITPKYRTSTTPISPLTPMHPNIRNNHIHEHPSQGSNNLYDESISPDEKISTRKDSKISWRSILTFGSRSSSNVLNNLPTDSTNSNLNLNSNPNPNPNPNSNPNSNSNSNSNSNQNAKQLNSHPSLESNFPDLSNTNNTANNTIYEIPNDSLLSQRNNINDGEEEFDLIDFLRRG